MLLYICHFFYSIYLFYSFSIIFNFLLCKDFTDFYLAVPSVFFLVEEPCNCGCNISKENGKIRSRITNKKKANCVWTITTEPHSYIQLQISTIKRGSLLVYISPTNKNPIIVNANDGNLKLPFTIKSDTNWMNISLYYDNLIHPKGGAYFDADFIGKFIRFACKLTFSRSSRPEVFLKKGVLRNFAKFRGKHLFQSLFFNKVTG